MPLLVDVENFDERSMAARTLDARYYLAIFRRFFAAKGKIDEEMSQLPRVRRALLDLKIALYGDPVRSAQLLRLYGGRLENLMERLESRFEQLSRLSQDAEQENQALGELGIDLTEPNVDFGQVETAIAGAVAVKWLVGVTAAIIATLAGYGAYKASQDTEQARIQADIARIQATLIEKGADPEAVAALGRLNDSLGESTAKAFSAIGNAVVKGGLIYLAIRWVIKKTKAGGRRK